MREFEKKLISILTMPLGVEKKNPEYLTALIAEIIITDQFYLKMKFPTQTHLSDATHLSATFIHQIWELLLKTYELIFTKQGVGTFVVAALSDEKIKAVKRFIDLQLKGNPTIVFDRKHITKRSAEFNVHVTRVFEAVSALPESQLKGHVEKQLSASLNVLMSKAMCYSFKNEEIYYARDYTVLMITICKLFLKTNSIFVSYRPGTTAVQSIVEKLKREVVVVGANTAINPLDELEANCKAGRVAIVHIGLSPFYPGVLDSHPAAWDKLLLLQTQYHFIIVLDDRFPGYSEVPQLWQTRKLKNNKLIIFLRPVTLVHQSLCSIEVVATSAYIRARIKKSVLAVTNRVSDVRANVLLRLLKDGSLAKAERKSNHMLSELIHNAKFELINSNLYKTSFIANQKAWFIYLEPRSGAFPSDLSDQLKQKNIHVMDTGIYTSAPYFMNGFWISLSDYKNHSSLLRDIKILNVFLKKVIVSFEIKG